MAEDGGAENGGREMAGTALTRRSGLLLAAGLCLAGCGLRPLYGTRGVGASVVDELAAVEVGVIPDRSGQVLRNALITRLNPDGRPTAPRYRLQVDLTESEDNATFDAWQGVRRRNLTARARFVLSDVATGEPVYSDTVTEITSFNVVRDEFTTITGQRDARDRALTALGDSIRLRIALFFDRRA